MKLFSAFIILLVFMQPANAQRADGFFLQEYCFVDPLLLKKLKIDKIEVTFEDNMNHRGLSVTLLDSACRKIKESNTLDGKTETAEFTAAPLTQFACPNVWPDYIKECSNGLITKRIVPGAYRETTFDSAGRVTIDRWKPGEKLMEIKREFAYSPKDMLLAIHLQDIRKDSTIDKEEAFIFEYTGEQLTSVRQMIRYGTSEFSEAGTMKHKHYSFGLAKEMKAVAYNGRYKATTKFAYYSGGKLLTD